MDRKTAFAVLVPIIFTASLFRVSSVESKAATKQGQTASDAIPAPANWVAFDASFRQSSNRGIVVVGKYHRRSDGSVRNETGPAEGPVKVITIHNISTGQFFTWINDKWVSNPMRLPPDGYRPGLRSLTRTQGLVPWPGEEIQGFEVYRYTTPQGIERFQAPALNLFALVTVFEGTHAEYYDINLREQPDELFMPPPGVRVEESQELRGIISNVTEAEQAILRQRFENRRR